jgi:hypothetical protein
MIEILASGLLGALLVFVLGLWVRRCERDRRVRGHWRTLSVEVKMCRDRATSYLQDNIAAPVYRLPTICFESSIPSLLSDNAISEDAAMALLTFYAEVQAMNRGLEHANSAFQGNDQTRLGAEFARNRLKAERIAGQNGSLYANATKVCDEGSAEPGIACRLH